MKKIAAINTITIKIKTIMTNIATLESIVYWANMVVIIALALSFLGGGASIIFSRFLNKEKDKRTKIEKAEAAMQIASLNAEATKAKEGIAVAQAQAAEANEKAETERLARVRIEASLAPRHLPAEHRMRLIEQLKANPGNILIWCLAGNPESCGFAKQIADILTSSGWSVEAIRDAVAMGSGSPPRGLFIQVKSERAIPVRAVKLQEALSQIGFPVLREIKSAYSQDTVGLVVGTKP